VAESKKAEPVSQPVPTASAPAAETSSGTASPNATAPAAAPAVEAASKASEATPAPAKTGGPSEGKPVGGVEIQLTGIAVTVSPDWMVEPFQPNAMSGTVAAYRLPKVEGEADDAILKISHFPSMKGMDAENINRWLGQVFFDGNPVTREAAKYNVEEKPGMRITTIDATGTIHTSMMGGGNAIPGQRMIAGIIDHPKGPHFVKVTGPEKTVGKWRDSVFAMISSATVK
jgi:hypothetical protein